MPAEEALVAGEADVDPARLSSQVAAFCGDCHGVPNPGAFPKAAWRREVERGFAFYFESGRTDLQVPSQQSVIEYYESRAPEHLTVSPPAAAVSKEPPRIKFRRDSSPSPDVDPPAVSFIDWLRVPSQTQRALVFCDMRSGGAYAASGISPGGSIAKLASLAHPSRVAPCDLDGDGNGELLIGELGSFVSEDHRRGAVLWVRWDPEQSAWKQRLLVSGLGRVADVRPGDFDGDGDADLVVAEFGHLRTGRVLMYENLGMHGGVPRLKERVLDPRHGAIHVPVADVNRDGRLDVVALLSQEYETVAAYLNGGDGSFERQTIYAAGDPAFGSSGIELVDLDRDGDLDVIYTNGDTFGSNYLKPYHGVSWLENEGKFPFTERRLAEMIGVQVAATGDLDGDDDLDIVAGGFLPPNLVTAPGLDEHDSLIWLEQERPGRFIRHSLEKGGFTHAALTIADFDQDGDADLGIGNFQDAAGRHMPWFTIWWNDR